ncbi:MFS transporter [Amycolatopsis japonica]|uniref:MFS transporter n=1 Tax=Amycolatopsis japonica TaxID=208439 RepID=UPI00331AE7DE
MPGRYRELFSAKGSLAFFTAGLVARMPVPMTGIGIITMLAQTRGDYGLAGLVSATFTLSMALLGPQVSRLVDRRGQSRILVPATGISVMALGALLLCARFGAPVWTLYVFAVLAGFMPSMAAMVRARWSWLYHGSPRLHTAFALESVVDELTFVIGPALSVALCTTVFPEAGPLVAVVFLAIGVVLFVAQRGTEPPVRPTTGSAGISPVRMGVVRVLVLTLMAGGIIVGTVDVVSVAFAERSGSPSAAGVVVSVYAVGSAISGLVFGTLKPAMTPPRLLLIGTAGTAASAVPLLLVDGVVGLCAVVFVAGLFFSPTMIVVMGMIETVVSAEKLTEGMTWAITGLSVGVALGAAVSGEAVDRFGPGGGFAVAVAAGALIILVALLSYPLLSRKTVTSEEVAC